MRPEDLLKLVKAVEFQAFRIVLDDGRRFEIHHPKMIKIGRTSLYVFAFSVEVEDLVERADILSLSSITGLEHIDVNRSA